MNRSQAIDRILAAVGPDRAARVAQGPMHALTSTFGLRVRPVEKLADRRGAGGWCDGLSFREHGVVLYAPSPYSRRENFTLVHELAHGLVDADDDVLDWIADQPDPGRELEAVCDAVAQRLLMPAAIIDAVLADERPRAEHVRLLHEASAASEPVCAIALAARLTCQGAVVISDLGGAVVSYASVRAPDDEGWPSIYPWPGQEIPAAHPLRLLRPGESRRQRSFWTAPWGGRQDYYLDVVAGRHRAHAVLAVYDLWGVTGFHGGDQPVTNRRPGRSLTCHCGFDGVVRGYPCTECRQPFCPDCKECRCDRERRQQVTCPTCFTAVKPNQLRQGGQRCLYCQ